MHRLTTCYCFHWGYLYFWYQPFHQVFPTSHYINDSPQSSTSLCSIFLSFSHPFISIFPSIFYFPLTMSTALNNAILTIDISCDSVMLLCNVMQSAKVEQGVLVRPVDVKEFLLWFRICPDVPCSELLEMMSDKAARTESAAK